MSSIAFLFTSLSLLGGCATCPETVEFSAPEGMVVVPAGWFTMGWDDGPKSSQPQREVYLGAFAIDRTEVTVAAFARFVAETGYQAPGWDEKLLGEHANEPVVGILWRDADSYCRWAGKRLPTEAEWEKAARGADGRRYPWGDTWDPSRANTAESGHGDALPIGSYPRVASPFGALDVAGNVSEWVADYYDPAYYASAPDHNPPGPKKVLDHVLRGGSWASRHTHAQTFFRDSSHSVRPNARVGFRCACVLQEDHNDH